MNLSLTKEEIYELTHRKKYSAQQRALNMMNIDFRVRPDGTILVLKNSLEPHQVARKVKRVEPNWDAVR